MKLQMAYKVVYWPGFLGRSEAAVLMLEDAGASYTVDNDVNTFISQSTGFPVSRRSTTLPIRFRTI